MLFLFKYIDDLIGKGFEWYIIVELLWYASATNVAMALPLAVLLSSIMTFGSLGENYELVAIKSAGISLRKAMTPLFILISMLGAGAFLFSDYMLPVANLKMLSLLYDVRNQKADFLIEEGVFNNSIPGYSIRVQKKDPDGQTLRGVLIYDQNKTAGMTVLMAREGIKYLSDDKNSLVLKLKDGVRYEEMPGQASSDKRQRFTRYRFKETEQTFDLSAFKFQRTDENLFKSSYQMLNLKQLTYYRDSVQTRADLAQREIAAKVKSRYRLFSPNDLKSLKKATGEARPYELVTDIIPEERRENATYNSLETVRQITETLKSSDTELRTYLEPVRRVIIEYHRKFTLSVACLLLFSIGAPLGAIIRKGGLGLPVVMSILFFLIFHIISTVAEKSAQQGSISPVWGMWAAIIILSPVGIFLTYKASVDSALFNVDYYTQLIRRLFTKKKA